jgi:DNA-directed RNA polymerase specialized sigma24 family protein
MEFFNFTTYLFVIPSIICIAICILTVLEKKKNKRLFQQLMETTVRLEVTAKELDNLQNNHRGEFHNSLQAAELTTKLQRPRLEAQSVASGQSPRRYSSVSSLAEEGLSAEEIASELAISPQEAAQLVNLARLAQGNIVPTVAN